MKRRTREKDLIHGSMKEDAAIGPIGATVRCSFSHEWYINYFQATNYSFIPADGHQWQEVCAASCAIF